MPLHHAENSLDLLYTENAQQLAEQLRDQAIKKYRLKSIFSGDLLESEIFPLWNTAKTAEVSTAKRVIKESSTAQKNLNHKNTIKNVVRLMESNFTSQDIWITLGYDDEHQPADKKTATKDLQNYLRRAKRYCKSVGIDHLRYLYVVHKSQKGRYHHHVVLGMPDRDKAEQLWTQGAYPQARRLKPKDSGLEGLARYIVMGVDCQKGYNAYGFSRGLYKSWLKGNYKTADSKVSKKKASDLATAKLDHRAFYAKLYPNYDFIGLEIRYSDYVSGCYLYAKLRKKPDQPPKTRSKRAGKG